MVKFLAPFLLTVILRIRSFFKSCDRGSVAGLFYYKLTTCQLQKLYCFTVDGSQRFVKLLQHWKKIKNFLFNLPIWSLKGVDLPNVFAKLKDRKSDYEPVLSEE